MSFANQVVDRCSSTNDLLKELGEQGYPHGTWVSAREQDAGRGRLGRSWSSREGNLFLSYLTRIENREVWSWIPLTAAVAVVRCLEELFPHVQSKIKWPNDILVIEQGSQAKLGGILCEGVSSQNPYVVVGIGLNCLNSPENITQRSAHLSAYIRDDLAIVDQVRLSLLESLDRCFDRILTEGADWVASEYQRFNLYSYGLPLYWHDLKSGKMVSGRWIGLGKAGELMVQIEDGETRHLFSEEVSQVRS